MSRNLGSKRCYYCGAGVVLTERPRPATDSDVWGEYMGMIIAAAECPDCLAKYMAWVHWGAHYFWNNPEWKDNGEFRDLSFRSSFNDEPGNNDLPDFVYETLTYRVKHRAPNCESCGNRKVMGYGCYCR